MNLGVDALHSSPPFPSPGSSFLPPPTPGPHEFARPPSACRRPSKNDLALTHNGSGIPSPPAANGHTTHTCSSEASPTASNGAVSPLRASLNFFRSFLPRFIISMLNVPRSLLRVLSFQESAVPTPTTDSPTTVLSPAMRDSNSVPYTPTELSYISPDPLPSNLDAPLYQDLEDPRLSPQPPLQNHRLSTQSVSSLTSSRPAPPSPAISRRASGLSRTSSMSRSRPVSGVNSRPVSSAPRPVSCALSPSAALSRTPSGRRAKDVLGMSVVTESKEKEKEPQTATPIESKILIKIRDFAFAPSDPRFSGEGLHVPRPNRPKVLARRLRGSSSSSISSVASSSSTEEEEDQWEDETDTNGWGGFKWGLQKLQSGWRFNSRSSDFTEDFPTRTDFARNFGDGSGDIDDDNDDGGDVYEDPDDYFENPCDDEDEEMEGEPALHPGLYRALYAFEPEGTAEMKLEEDQIVRVVGRGGGVGWAVVVKDGLKDTGVHALVPQSYLEVVRLDGDEEV